MSEQILLLNRRPHRRRPRRARRARRRGLPAGLKAWMEARQRARTRGHNRRPRRRRRKPHQQRMRRHYKRSDNRSRRYHHRARRRGNNPRRWTEKAVTTLQGGLVPAVIGGGGALLLDLTWGAITQTIPQKFNVNIPTTFQTGWGALAAKSAVVFGLGWAANRFAPRFRRITSRAVIGAYTVLAYGAVKGLAQNILPSGTPGLSGYIDYHSYALPGTRMAGYMPRTLGSLEDLYSPAAVIQPSGTPVPRQFGGYIAKQPGMSGYMQPHMMGGNSGLMGYDWTHDGM